jgi:GNAT superfamily N-acetyltransferase
MKIEEISFETIQEIWYEEDMWGQLAYAEPVNTLLYLKGYNNKIRDLSYSTPVYYAYLVDGNIAGVNSFHKVNEKQCRSRGLYVYPKYRKMNIGIELLKYAIDQNKNKGYDFIWSMPRSTAIETYKKAGFKMTTEIISHLPDGQKLLYNNCFCKKIY